MIQRRIFLTVIFSGLFALNFSFQNCADVEFGLVGGMPLEALSEDFEIGEAVEPIPVIPVARESQPSGENQPTPEQEVIRDDSGHNENNDTKVVEKEEDSEQREVVDSEQREVVDSEQREVVDSEQREVESENRDVAVQPPGQDHQVPTPEPSRDQIDLACGISGLSDIRINIRDVYLGNTLVSSLYGVRSLAELAEGLPLFVATATRANQISIVLESEGNQLVDAEGRSLELVLRTPSAQQSGLKLNMRGNQLFQANSDYVVQFDLSSVKLLQAGNSGRCILTPSLSVTSVEKR